MAVAVFILLSAGLEAPASCRDQVAAAFERLRISMRPYRKETTIVVSPQQTFHQVAEFLPPDRLREITNNGAPGYGTSEVIRIGPRAWSNERGWREWEPGLAQEIYGEAMDFLSLPDRAVPANLAFECLERVVFKGAVYIGYRAQLPKAIVSFRQSDAAWSEQELQQVLSELQRMPQERRTVFLELQNALPAFDLVAPDNQLDNARSRIQYTYPDEIRIEPPVQ